MLLSMTLPRVEHFSSRNNAMVDSILTGDGGDPTTLSELKQIFDKELRPVFKRTLNTPELLEPLRIDYPSKPKSE